MEHGANFPKTLLEAIKYFSDLDTANTFMAQMRWPEGVTCPYCAGKAVSYLSTRHKWKCMNKECHKQFSVKVGTIMEDSPIGLDKWLAAIWIIANAKNGVSSYEIHRALGITQKSAWFLLHRIRLAMQTGTFEKLSGQVEADETFIGGRARYMHKDKREAKIQGRGSVGKVAVMGLLERHGEVRTRVISNTSQETLHKAVRNYVEPGAELFTDAFISYKGLEANYIHQVIDHAEKYVDGNVHTNSIENFWCLLKRSIKGTYVSVEPFHLFRYLDEQSFRFNERKGKDADRFVKTVRAVSGKRLTYEQLTGEESE
ncbi:MAG: IS1595 family transposase [Acidobacteriota bacterium]|nr:IS1595 family transposase [Acidobacteriota bacterium]